MTGVKVAQWVVARELHADAGVSESNSHYHMAMKLEKRARWLKGHPDLSNARPPRTEKAISGNKRKAVGRTGAAAQNREGKTELAEFICNRGGKAVDECLAIAQELATAEAKYERSLKTCMQLLHESYS
ncbi:unnamed protein product, partial [Porites evermanni]